MGQGDSAGDFDPSEGMENAGILDVFPIFHTARLGQKIRRSTQFPLCGAALILIISIIPKGYHNCQLFIVNCQLSQLPLSRPIPNANSHKPYFFFFPFDVPDIV